MGAGVLGVARLYQRHQVEGILRAYGEADLEELDVQTYVLAGRDGVAAERYIQLEQPLPYDPDTSASYGWQGSLLVAEFDGLVEPMALRVHYVGVNAGFSCAPTVTVHPPEGKSVGVRYFIPIIEWYGLGTWSRFEGLAAPEGAGPRFRRLYRVPEAGELDMWLHMALPSDTDAFVYWQRLASRASASQEMQGVRLGEDPYTALMEGPLADPNLSFEEREALLREALEQWPRNGMLWFALGVHLEINSKLDEARRAYLQAIKAAPALEPAYAALSELIQRDRGEAAVSEAMRGLASASPENYAPRFFLGLSLEMDGHKQEALKAYREALKRFPGHALSQKAVKRLTGVVQGPVPSREVCTSYML
ncbi:MAG TPA: tetratricopeptide repeat protein, partial [Candidatus Hydrogenedentes bacterium]|nr:tetratricopeptide repeat protein [Candidatus Hydrogenedentota bacterium]